MSDSQDRNARDVPATLPALLQARAASARSLTLVAGDASERVVGYPTLRRAALARLAVWQQAGARAGDAAILLLEDRLAFLEHFWAAVLGGMAPVPVAGGISDDHRLKLYRIAERLAGDGGAPWLVTDASSAARLATFAGTDAARPHAGIAAALTDRLRLVDGPLAEVDADAHAGASAQVHAAVPDDVALVQFSSGSTSAPKGVVLTHRNLLANLDGILTGMAMRTDDRMLSWMPLTHDMGLIGFHLTPMAADIDHLLLPTDAFVRRPALWLSTASAHRATVLCSPNFGYEHYLKSFKADRLADLDLACVRLIFNGAEPISAALVERFNTTLAPTGLEPTAMFPVYGLAEASLAVTFPAIGSELQVRHLSRGALGIGDRVASAADGAGFVAVGRTIPHVEVRLADAAGATLGDGRVGRLTIRGENVTDGYLGDGGLAAPRDRSLIDEDGWLDTGDLAVRLEGELYITGRAKDLIFVNGQNLYPHDLERTVQAAGLVEAGKIAIAAAPGADPGRDRIVAFVQFRGDMDAFSPLTARLQEELSRHGVRLDAAVAVARIPKTTSGKVQRFMLVAERESGEHAAREIELAPVTSSPSTSTSDEPTDASVSNDAHVAAADGRAATEATVESRLLAMCRARVTERALARDDNLFELGISSLTLAEIHADIESEWPDTLDITDLFDYPSVAEIATVLEQRTASSG